MREFELRPMRGGLALSGEPLEDPLKYSTAEMAIRLVGFLSQRDGSVLQIFDAGGNVIETQKREPTIFMKGAVGGLEGPH